MAHKEQLAGIILKGLSGKISVNGTNYDGVMPPVELLSDEQVADVATYISVSYTRLRAHETVLDLVCRLLLEKKNT